MSTAFNDERHRFGCDVSQLSKTGWDRPSDIKRLRNQARLLSYAITLALANTSGMLMLRMAETASLDTVMRTLADPTRRAVFERIVQVKEISVLELTRGSGVTQSAISQHLRSLKQAGLVSDYPRGRHVFYHAEPNGLAPLFDWMSHYGAFWHDRFADLRTVLKEIDHE